MNPKICPKCHRGSGDDWSQCEGVCPMEGSPHYNPLWLSQNLKPQLPPLFVKIQDAPLPEKWVLAPMVAAVSDRWPIERWDGCSQEQEKRAREARFTEILMLGGAPPQASYLPREEVQRRIEEALRSLYSPMFIFKGSSDG